MHGGYAAAAYWNKAYAERADRGRAALRALIEASGREVYEHWLAHGCDWRAYESWVRADPARALAARNLWEGSCMRETGGTLYRVALAQYR